jgi:DNA-binding HxlR family transcriptional regulator/putative sterol carrier protein
MARRSYDQYCGLARALDVLGERWTLLVIRELMLGPKRFSDLLEGLPGIGANVLSTRLKALEGEGVIERRRLPPPAASTVYELTARGRELEPAVFALMRWGIDLLGSPSKDDRYRPGWLFNGLRAAFEPEMAKGVRRTYRLRVDDETFTVRVDDGTLDVEQGQAGEPDVAMAFDSRTLMAITAGELTPEEAIESGRVRIESGDPAEAIGLASMLRLSHAAVGAAAPS